MPTLSAKLLFYRLKPALDAAVSALALVALAPFLLMIAVVMRIAGCRPVLFRQVRVGYRERQFLLYKFRTMTDQRDRDGRLLPDEERLTAIGRLLRGTSLDELPQLWNVLRGEMSLVGPRPLLPEYLPRYSAFQRRRHEVKPGITGWAQVTGRNTLSWENKFEMDVWYVDHRNFWLDLRILWLTVINVIRREGISQKGHATMPEFLGGAARDERP